MLKLLLFLSETQNVLGERKFMAPKQEVPASGGMDEPSGTASGAMAREASITPEEVPAERKFLARRGGAEDGAATAAEFNANGGVVQDHRHSRGTSEQPNFLELEANIDLSHMVEDDSASACKEADGRPCDKHANQVWGDGTREFPPP